MRAVPESFFWLASTLCRRDMTWRDYQEEVAAFFRELGFTVKVEATLQGIRTTHNVDVWAQAERFGLFTRWVIECKQWQSSVPKEKVLALRSIVDDLGADRGFIMNERGFQSGAYDAAEYANVTVTSLRELRDGAIGDISARRLDETHRRLIDIQRRASRLHVTVKRTPSGGTVRLRRGVKDGQQAIGHMGIIPMTEGAVASARIGQFPVVLPRLDDIHQMRHVNSPEEMAQIATELVDLLEDWLAEQEAGVTDADGWGEPSI